MSDIALEKELPSLSVAVDYLDHILSAYMEQRLNKKQASKISKKVLSMLRNYNFSSEEKDKFEFIEDLCLSFTTIERTKGDFEQFFFDSLVEELSKAKKM